MHAEGFHWDHEIQLALPPSYFKTKESYPVLWVMDGSWMFQQAVVTVNGFAKSSLPEMIIVGVGSTPEASDDEYLGRRLYDFTPTTKGPEFDGFGSDLARAKLDAHRKNVGALASGGKLGFGGAPEYLRFLVDSVRPRLARDYRMSNEQVLFGDSGGGIFCTYVLLTRPEAFKGYICGSPALYWGNYELFRMEEHYARAHKELAATVFFGAGEEEVAESNGIVSSMARMAEILEGRRYSSLRLHVRIFPGEGHNSVIPLNLTWGLRTIFQIPVAGEPH